MINAVDLHELFLYAVKTYTGHFIEFELKAPGLRMVAHRWGGTVHAEKTILWHVLNTSDLGNLKEAVGAVVREAK